MAIILPSYLGAASTPVRSDRAGLESAFLAGDTGFSTREGILPGPNNANSATGSGVINIGAFRAIVLGDYTLSGQSQGAYVVSNDATVAISMPTSASQWRRDRIVVQINDSQYSGSTDNATLGRVAGTPAGSAAAATLPTLPSSALELYQVLVNSDGSMVVTDTRVYSGSANGITPVSGYEFVSITDAGAANTPYVGKKGVYEGQYRDHPFYGLQRWSVAIQRWDSVAGGAVNAFPTTAVMASGTTMGFEAVRISAAYPGQRFQSIFQGNFQLITANVQQTIQVRRLDANPGQNYTIGQSSLEHVERFPGAGGGQDTRVMTRVFDWTAGTAGVCIINLEAAIGTGTTSVGTGNFRVWTQTASALT